MNYLIVIQARLTSTRFPNKVMQMVGGKTMVRRVWDAANLAASAMRVYHKVKVIVAWPERWPDVDENDLHTKFLMLANEYKPDYIIRLTADCPLLTYQHILEAVELCNCEYYNNGLDGYDVQVFTPDFLRTHPNREHVLEVPFNYGGTSVNTPEDLKRVRHLAK